MKIFSAILLLAIIFLQTFSRFVIEAEYFLNRSFIANNLCENKAKPEMHCMGKCFLNKQLKQQEKQEHKSPFNLKDKLDVQLFVLGTPIAIQKAQLDIATEFFTPDVFYHSSFVPSIFHPPT